VDYENPTKIGFSRKTEDLRGVWWTGGLWS
jgi:hypothetical protein